MPVIERRFALRVAANLTAFLRFDAGLVRGPEPREGGLARERRLTRRMRKLHEREEGLRLALDESKKLLAEAQWQLQNKQERLAELEAAASGVPQRWKWTNYIVSSEHRIIYLRVPKVASTSMQIALLRLFNFKGLRPYRDFYDERLAEIVGERYRDDAEIFGYSF